MTPALKSLKANIERVVQSQGIAVSTVSLEDSASFVDNRIISMVEVEEPVIMGGAMKTFSISRHWLNQPSTFYGLLAVDCFLIPPISTGA